VVNPDGFGQRAPFDEAHGVERLLVLGPPGQLIDRNDAGVLQLAGDPSLLQEAGRGVGVVGTFGAELLESNLAAQVPVAGQPDLANAALGMQPGQRVALTAARLVSNRGGLHSAVVRRQVTHGLLDDRVSHLIQHALRLAVHYSSQARVLISRAVLRRLDWDLIGDNNGFSIRRDGHQPCSTRSFMVLVP